MQQKVNQSGALQNVWFVKIMAFLHFFFLMGFWGRSSALGGKDSKTLLIFH